MNQLNQIIWIEDEEYVYLPGEIIGRENNQLKIEVWLNSKKQIRFLDCNKEVIKVQELACPDDLFTLQNITQEYLLYILRKRYDMNNYFTLINKHLALWVNPYSTTKSAKLSENVIYLIREFCSNIIKEELTKKNIQASLSQSQSLTSFQFQTHNHINEGIVLFGQTMSGKTTLSLSLINTLLEMSNDITSMNPALVNNKEMIKQSINIIKLFNQCGQSSKSCLLINLNYDMANANIVSCKCIPFLLLTDTLTSISQNKIFNIFTVLIETMSDEDKLLYLHKPKGHFIYLSKPTNSRNDTTINYNEFKSFITSTSINKEHFNAFISILMSILYFGNLQFMIDQSNNEVDINPHSKEDLKAISTLLSIEYQELKRLFIQSKTIANASLLRNKIIHLLYINATDWLLNQINHYFNEIEKEYSLKFNHYQERKKIISVFDSIGYQNDAFNSNDNFIINYANEKIIELFNQKMLSIEQTEYKRESIQWKAIDFFDNSEVISLFESKGLIDLLDELTLKHNDDTNDNNTDKSFYNKVYQSYSNSIALGIKCNDFISVNHSFGDIHYYINGFIDRNIKMICKEELNNCFESSSNYSINQILNYNKSTNAESLIKHYKKRIDEFITILSHSNLRFIRCFNSNTMPDMEFNSSFFYSQVMPINIPQIFSLMKQKFNNKMTYDSFIRKCAVLNKEILYLIRTYDSKKEPLTNLRQSLRKSANNNKVIIIEIISILKRNKKLKQSLSNIQIGLTIVYLHDDAINDLNDTIKNIHHVRILQRNMIKLVHMRKSAKKIQRAYMAFCKQKQMKAINEAYQNKVNIAKVKSLSAKKLRQKNVLDILKKEQSNLVETELLQMVKNYQEEINILRDVHIENEQLRKKNSSLQLQVASIEKDKEKEHRKERESAAAPRNSTSKSALALLTEISSLKKKIKEYEIKLETQIITMQQNEHRISDLKTLNETLQDQISKRSQNDLNELNHLMKRIAIIEQEKKEYEDKFNIDYTNNSNMLSKDNQDKEQSKTISDYKRQLLTIKSELKQSKTYYNELKSNYDTEVNKTKALTEKLSQEYKPKCIKDIECAIEMRFTIYNYNKEHQKELKLKDKEIALLKEQLSTCIEKQEKKTEAYQNQLLLSSQELKNRNEYISQLQNSLDIQMETSIQRRKEIFNMKKKEIISPLTQYNTDIVRKKDKEINQLRELLEKKQKLYEDSCLNIEHKKRVITKKKEENDLLVTLFKNKKSELQCVEALKYANSTTIKDKLLKVQDQEQELIKKVEALANDVDYSDDSEDELIENDEEENKNKLSDSNQSIESFPSLDDDN